MDPRQRPETPPGERRASAAPGCPLCSLRGPSLASELEVRPRTFPPLRTPVLEQGSEKVTATSRERGDDSDRSHGGPLHGARIPRFDVPVRLVEAPMELLYTIVMDAKVQDIGGPNGIRPVFEDARASSSASHCDH